MAQLTTDVVIVLSPNTQEEMHGATRTICGSPHIKGAKDAKVILEALGLLDPKGK